MTDQTQLDAARSFRDLHHDDVLVLPCAWDCASAAVFEDAGFSAIGTTSSGIAHSLGYPDGEHLGVDEMVRVVDRISDVVSSPVSADFEAGYGRTHDEVTENVEAIITAGAVGINIEDGTGPRANPFVPVEDQATLITSIRERSEAIGISLVINARTDVFLKGDGSREERLDRAIQRANSYLEAGATCVFPIGVTDRETIRAFVSAVDGPVNVMANDPSMPPVDELAKMGVRRVSVGGGAMNATVALVHRIAAELRSEGTFSYLDGAFERSVLQTRFRGGDGTSP